MNRLSVAGILVGLSWGCAGAAHYPTVGTVVGDAREDQLAFATKYQEKGIAFRGTVQKKGLKASTATGFDFSAYGIGQPGTGVVVSGTARKLNVNYGYVFVGEGTDEKSRALCLFEPSDLKQAAALNVGQLATFTCLFSKFVGDQASPTPVFWGCSVID